MSPTLIHLGASGSSPNDKGEWTQTGWDKYCISREGERKDAMEPRDTEWRWDIVKESQEEKHLKERMRQTLSESRGEDKAKVIAGQMLLSKDTECWWSWIFVKFTLSSPRWPWKHLVFRSTAACLIIDPSQTHASFKSINFLKQAWIDETDWKFKKCDVNLS